MPLCPTGSPITDAKRLSATNAQVRIIPDGQALAGQFGAFARRDNAAPLPEGYLLPFVGRIVEDGGRDAFELELGQWRGKDVVLDPDSRCAGTYVNDAFGPDRAARAAASAGSSRPPEPQNVEFFFLKGLAGFPHAFWRVIRPIVPGTQVRAAGLD